MPALVWHPDALDDIARLYDFLNAINPTVAQRAARLIREAADKIADHPEIGRPHAEFREWSAKLGRSTYVIRFFIVSSGDILVTRVWHSRQLPPV